MIPDFIASLLSRYVGPAAFAETVKLGKKFLSSKYALAAGGAFALALTYQTGHLRGYEAAMRKVGEDTTQHDLAIQRDIAATVGKQRDALARQTQKLQEKVAKYEAGIKSGPCTLNSRDVRRLRSIR